MKCNIKIVTTGTLLDANVDALVNAVNTVGVMGKGLALQFKYEFPENYWRYKEACQEGKVKTGEVFVTETGSLFGPKFIINFPTKQHWQRPSKLGWIEQGLVDLVRVTLEKNISSIALPALGCGNGGLRWDQVKPLIIHAFGSVPDVEVLVYAPKV